jgi:isoquinoline 1-oxidoreductase beta subunit
VAVVAEGFWAARRGRDALAISWLEGSGREVDDTSIARELETLVRGEGRVARREGVASAPVARTIEATYQVPFLAHATMEPMNCVADVRKDSVTVWVPTQFQAAPWYVAGGGARGVAASVAGVAPERVTVHTTHLGGGFGRRFELDVVREAVELSKRVGGPVRLIWTREDDLQHDWYRPAARHLLEAGLDHSGGVVSWNHRTASPSIMAKFMPGFLPEWATHLAGPLKGGIDQSAVEGAVDHRYRIPRVEVRYAQAHLPVPVGYWRSVGHSHTAFAVESFIDEIAHESGKDPIALRLSLLGDAPRHRGVLERVRQGAGWDSAPPAGVFRGVAVHESFASVVALVAEVSIAGGNRIRVHRVVAAIDCGMVVNPDTVRAQVESGIVFGLSAALMGRISIDQGRVAESNFHDYPVLRMSEMPVVETHIIPSRLDPTGVGEPATPPVAPAVANAVFAATGQRLRSLPLRLG